MTKVVYKKEIEYCRECPHCKIMPDPDPNDWFNYDDEKALCFHPDYKEGKVIDVALRPYEKVFIPTWCPLKK